MLTCGISREIIALRAARTPEINWKSKQKREDEVTAANKVPWSLHKRLLLLPGAKLA